MSNFDLSAIALKAVCPNNELLYDDKGMPSVMVKIPKMTYADLGMGDSTDVFPAFIVNGKAVDAIYISKYQNIVENGRAYSLPGRNPTSNIGMDDAINYCTSKGVGWHLMTRMEWALIIRWCQANGVMPKGNNWYGRHYTESVTKAIPATKDSSGRTAKILTGTGPMTWNHDQSPSGIADLGGNLWEWNGGVRLFKGEVQVLAGNNAADSAHSQSESSVEWKAIKASDGSLIPPDGNGSTPGSVKLDMGTSKITFSTTISRRSDSDAAIAFASIECDSSIGANAKLLLQSLALLQYGSSNELFESHSSLIDNINEDMCMLSGGRWGMSACGAASYDLKNTRNMGTDKIGFRCAYVKLP